MNITDKVYGELTITEPILLELLESSELERLKKISQYGVPDKYCHKKNFNRYEHSVGVMLLLRILGASVQEQVAGLLHDVSHSSFSHVVDWVFGEGVNGKENFQDNFHDEYIKKTTIPKILKKHGLSIADVVNNPSHTLLESDLPDICADRVDYTLRETSTDKSGINIQKIIDSLKAFDNRIIFTSPEEAKTFAIQYLYLQKTNWGSLEARMDFALLGDALKSALNLEIIHKDDLWEKDEEELLEILETSEDSKIQFCLKELASKKPKVAEKRYSNKKVRFVDPLIVRGGKLCRLSELDHDFAVAMKKSIEDSKRVTVLPHY